MLRIWDKDIHVLCISDYMVENMVWAQHKKKKKMIKNKNNSYICIFGYVLISPNIKHSEGIYIHDFLVGQIHFYLKGNQKNIGLA